MTDLEERIARHVYRAMCWDSPTAPEWPENETSSAKELALTTAQDILNDIKAQEKTDDQST